MSIWSFVCHVCMFWQEVCRNCKPTHGSVWKWGTRNDSQSITTLMRKNSPIVPWNTNKPIWGFTKIGVPPQSSILIGIFPNKNHPAIGYPHGHGNTPIFRYTELSSCQDGIRRSIPDWEKMAHCPMGIQPTWPWHCPTSNCGTWNQRLVFKVGIPWRRALNHWDGEMVNKHVIHWEIMGHPFRQRADWCVCVCAIAQWASAVLVMADCILLQHHGKFCIIRSTNIHTFDDIIYHNLYSRMSQHVLLVIKYSLMIP